MVKILEELIKTCDRIIKKAVHKVYTTPEIEKSHLYWTGRFEERRLDLCIDKFSPLRGGVVFIDDDSYKVNPEALYQLIYNKLENKLHNIKFSSNHLKEIILKKANGNEEGLEKLALGMLSGGLLELFTKRCKYEGKYAKIHIDGKGSRFPYLFHRAREVEELIVKNFVGDHICSKIAYNGGVCDSVIVVNCKGDEIASNIAGNKGRAEIVAVINNKGWKACGGIASHEGHVTFALVANSEGEYALSHAADENGCIKLAVGLNNKGECIAYNAADGGTIDSLIIYNNEGKSAARNIALDGNINLIFAENCKGDYSLNDCGLSRNRSGPRIKTVIAKNIQGYEILSNLYKRVEKLIYYNISGKNMLWRTDVEKIIKNKEALLEYDRIIREYNIDKIMGLEIPRTNLNHNQVLKSIKEYIKIRPSSS